MRGRYLYGERSFIGKQNCRLNCNKVFLSRKQLTTSEKKIFKTVRVKLNCSEVFYYFQEFLYFTFSHGWYDDFVYGTLLILAMLKLFGLIGKKKHQGIVKFSYFLKTEVFLFQFWNNFCSWYINNCKITNNGVSH